MGTRANMDSNSSNNIINNNSCFNKMISTHDFKDYTEDGKLFYITVGYRYNKAEEETNYGANVEILFAKVGEDLIDLETTSFTEEYVKEKIMDYELDKLYT